VEILRSAQWPCASCMILPLPITANTLEIQPATMIHAATEKNLSTGVDNIID
jgi:hypothetical protein